MFYMLISAVVLAAIVSIFRALIYSLGPFFYLQTFCTIRAFLVFSFCLLAIRYQINVRNNNSKNE